MARISYVDDATPVTKTVAAPNKPAPNIDPAPNTAKPTRNVRGRVPETERAYQRDLMRKRRADAKTA